MTGVKVLCDAQEAESVLARWLRDALDGLLPPAMGLDVEWVPRSDRPALLQLSTPSGQCALLRLCQFGEDEVPSLAALLREPRVLKAGVGVVGDVARLRELPWLRDTVVAGVCELVPLASRVAGFTGAGLAALASHVLDRRVLKLPEVRCSDWSAATLTDEQVRYAAEDAEVSLAILLRLHASHAPASMGPVEWVNEVGGIAPPPKHRAKARGALDAMLNGALHRGKARAAGPAHAPAPGGAAGGAASGAAGAGPSRRVAMRASPLYDGWLMRSPEGEHMCRLTRARALWYVDRGLAELDAGGESIRLLFAPKGLGNAAEPWLTEPKANACVGCGVDQQVPRRDTSPQNTRRREMPP